MPQAMLFVRGENAGISHNPLESITDDDVDLAVRAFGACSRRLADGAAGDLRRRDDRPRTARRLDRRALRRGGALPAGAGARADRHPARRQRAARRAHRGPCSGGFGFVERHPVPVDEVRAAGHGVDHET
jgi:hypothetical protein